MLTIKGPFGLASAMATNVIDTGTHSVKTGSVRDFVRASTTVGENGSNNTLMGTEKRLINVGTVVCSRANSCANCKFTVPAAVVGGIITSLGRFNVIRHTRLNITNDSISLCVSDRGTRNHRISLKAMGNICVKRIVPGAATRRTNLQGKSIIATIGNGRMGGVTRLRRILGAVHPNSGIGVACVHSGGGRATATMLHGTRNAAHILRRLSVSRFNTTLGPVSSTAGRRLGLPFNLRIVTIGGNGVTSTNIAGNLVVLRIGSHPVGALRSFGRIIGRAGHSDSHAL